MQVEEFVSLGEILQLREEVSRLKALVGETSWVDIRKIDGKQLETRIQGHWLHCARRIATDIFCFCNVDGKNAVSEVDFISTMQKQPRPCSSCPGLIVPS